MMTRPNVSCDPSKSRPYFVFDPILGDFQFFTTQVERDKFYLDLKEEMNRSQREYLPMLAAICGKVEDFHYTKERLV